MDFCGGFLGVRDEEQGGGHVDMSEHAILEDFQVSRVDHGSLHPSSQSAFHLLFI